MGASFAAQRFACRRARAGLMAVVLGSCVLPALLSAAQAQGTAEGISGWGATVSRPAARARSSGKSAEPATPSGRIASGVAISGDSARTLLHVELSGEAAFTAFRLSAPYRVILDLDRVSFRLPQGSGRQAHGLVQSFRYGLFSEGKGRIVIDTSGPVRIERAEMVQAADGTARLALEITPTTAGELAAGELAAAAQALDLKLEELQAAQVAQVARPSAVQPPASDSRRPVIVIDPGHGGIDPGAQGTLGYEKDLVLAVAREVRRALLATRRYEVVMTRSGDVFLSLDQRIRLSRQSQADLFVSIHADSLAQKEYTQSVRGATVYTLSDKASDEGARALADKENAADLLAGLKVASAGDDAQVRTILVDLMRRESSNLATDFRSLLVQQIRPRMALAKDPMRSAPFKVLRQPGSPAVLFELGYLSNAEDERQMTSATWRRGMAEAFAKAVDEYFRRNPGR